VCLERAFDAMMGMKKFDVAAIKAARLTFHQKGTYRIVAVFVARQSTQFSTSLPLAARQGLYKREIPPSSVADGCRLDEHVCFWLNASQSCGVAVGNGWLEVVSDASTRQRPRSRPPSSRTCIRRVQPRRQDHRAMRRRSLEQQVAFRRRMLRRDEPASSCTFPCYRWC
jgi:hypothetical protein